MKQKAHIWIITTLLLLFSLLAAAQSGYRLIYHSIDKDSTFIRKELLLQPTFSTYLQASQYLEKLPTLLHSKGFISASIDTIISYEKEADVYIYAGERFGTLQLYTDPATKAMIQQAGINLTGNTLAFDQYATTSDRLLNYFETSGYPFAQVRLDSIQVSAKSISAHLIVDKGILYHIDSIRVYGPARLSKNFIHHYLNILPGSVYDKAKLDKINQRIAELPYVESIQPWDLTMLSTGSIVNLYLKPKRSNEVNILAGFLPSNEQTGGKLLFTVDAHLQLKNAFGGGESLGVIWQQLQPRSPRGNLSFGIPYLFHSPFGIDLGFDLYKRDSAFLNIYGQLGLSYVISGNQTGRVIFQTQKTNVLNTDTNFVKSTKRLPDVANVSSNSIGLNYEVNTTNYRFNPARGNELSFTVLTGRKTVSKDNAITKIKDTAFNYNSLYDTVKLKSNQVRLQVNGAHYLKVGKSTVLKTAINSGWFESPNYFSNELFRIGGYKLLRGFDEENIFANRYAVGTLEYRYLVDQNSHLAVFSDFGWSHNSIVDLSNTYVSAGIGLSLQSKNSIINVSYAVGKRNDQSFSLRQSKIHIGYVSLF